LFTNVAFAQVIDFEDFGTGPYPGPELPAGQTTYIFNAPNQPALFPNILDDGEYVLATDSQQGFVNWSSIGDNTTGTGYMLLVNADENQSGEFYRRRVTLTANTTFDFLAYLVTVNSQEDFDFCTNNEGGLVLPNVTFQVEDVSGTVLGSFDTGDIPFNATPEWEEYKLVFTTLASTSEVDVVLINNSLGGCGNDLAIDDITFRVAVTVEAFDDSVTVTDTSSSLPAVLTLGGNDTLDGNPLPGTELYAVASGSVLPAELTLDTNTGEVGVVAGTVSGTYEFDYTVCETSSLFNCDTATATVIVDLPPLPITAVNDSGVVADASLGVPVVLNVLDNDTIDGVSPPVNFDLSLAAGSVLPTGITFDEATGAVGVELGTPTNIYSFDYNLCEAGDPTNCETATVTLDVTNPNPPSVCPIGRTLVNGTFHVLAATGGTNSGEAVGEPLAQFSTGTDSNSGRTFSPSIVYTLTDDPDITVPEGTMISVSLGRHFGNSGDIAISASLDQTNFPAIGSSDSLTVSLNQQNNTLFFFDYVVPAGGARFMELDHISGGIRFDGVTFNSLCTLPPNVIIEAENDTGSVPDSSVGNTTVLNVLDNDTIDGNSPIDFDLSLVSGETLPSGIAFDFTTGAVEVLLNAPEGIVSFDYQICEVDAPLNCDVATVTIDVTNPGGGAFCPAGTTAVDGTFHVVSATGTSNAGLAVGQPLSADGTSYPGVNQNAPVTFFNSIEYTLTDDEDITVPEGTIVRVLLGSHFGGTTDVAISASLDMNFPDVNSDDSLTVSIPSSNNVLSFFDYVIPMGGARFMEIDYLQNTGGGGARFDGVIYNTQCQIVAAPASLNASKAVTVYDPQDEGLYAIPGNDVIYTLTVENPGDGDVDDGSLFLVDNMPSEVTLD